MSLKKLKKKTSTLEKINNIEYIKFSKNPHNCKVVEVKEDLTCVIVMFFKKKLLKWDLILNSLLINKDDELNIIFKNRLESLVKDKYLTLTVSDYKNGKIYGTLFDKYYSINLSMKKFIMYSQNVNNQIINNKIKNNKLINNETNNKISKLEKKKCLEYITLSTIFEDKVTEF
tara:strand:+ start:471 stop:989 length:519 start_codon:yes stop_codon:yes gene_type:complete